MLYLFLAFLLSTHLFAQSDPTVQIDSGDISGLNRSGNDVFLGIPYAQPPVGNLRWRTPQPVTPWNEIRATKDFGDDCMQVIDPDDTSPLQTTPSEDCLYLNVWRPEGVGPGRKLPVIVWIHGGGYTDGGSSREIFDGDAFADQGIVFVSFNYRLGRFGFFAHPALTAAAEGRLGNYGFEDQLAALKWVQKNVQNFGGDPGNVTLLGESAGGSSVVQWLTSTDGANLFHKAIVMSGGGRDFLLGNLPLKSLNPLDLDAEKTGIRFAEENDIEGDDAQALNELRNLSATTVRGDISLNHILSRLAIPDLTYAGGPIIDGQTVTSLPDTKFASGQINKVPLIIGTTDLDLGVAYATSKERLFEKYFEEDAELAQSFYDPDGSQRLATLLVEVGADFMMQEPARFVGTSFNSASTNVWLYRFAYVPVFQRLFIPGAVHGSDVPFVFKTLDARYGDAVLPEDRALSESINSYFVTFAKTGIPAPFLQPEWGAFNAQADEILIFTSNKIPTFVEDPLNERLNLVERYQ